MENGTDQQSSTSTHHRSEQRQEEEVKTLAAAVAAIGADPQAREGADAAPLPSYPLPAQYQWDEVPTKLAAQEVGAWLDEVATEADLIAEMVVKHAGRLAGCYAARANPTAARDKEYREAFRPFRDTAELRREIERHSRGKQGRLMTRQPR